MTTHYLKQCRPDAEETAYFWKLYHAAQRVEDRWCRNTVPDIAEALSYCSELSREQKLFLLRAWQVLVDDKGGFDRFMGAFDCYVHNVQDPTDNCVAYKPELKRHIEKGYLFDTVEEAYNEARQRIAELQEQKDKWAAWAIALGAKADELEAKPLCVKLPDEFTPISENILTQDNRITSDPMFCVFQKREVVADADYDHDRIVWADEDGNEANERQRARLELLHDNCREVPEKWRRVAVKEIDDFVTCCFTEQGCKDYLACNGHNLRFPFIYVKSGFRNTEYQTIRNWLMTVVGTAEGE